MRQIFQYIDLVHNKGLYYINGEAFEDISETVIRRYYGEAFFLKAWAEWELLKVYGGPDNEGNMLGFPIVNEILEDEEYASLSRDSYDDCVAQIMADLDVAIDSLPLTYSGSDAYIGNVQIGRASGLAAYALKAKVALYAASPAFNPTNDLSKWEEAAALAHEAIMQNSGSLKSLQDYDYTSTTNVDHIWRLRDANLKKDLEERLYPPTLYGQGEVNPSQNLVDAFPDSKGYPISMSVEYDPANPYASRDDRFYKFIFYNTDRSFTSETGSDYDSLQIYEGGLDNYGGFMRTEGTRTGYYLKRFLNKLNFDPSVDNATTSAARVYVQLGLTELYLNYAEAANEAFGPDIIPAGYNFSAKDALAQVRKRAGITSDEYLDLVAANSADFRTLLKNERRIEMCFSGERFHDLRRWNDIVATEDVRGMKITKNADGTFSYQEVEVENRTYEAKNSYLPLPYAELILNSNLKQNQGW
ncbi:SusD family protein [Saccharicrinis fermentans DSM 9555 = JCM 21142]|uniref:SusD family protein n=4 Tax=Saccharicrinis fermentans TaxID=982 RepID=W7XUF2_9BACT|nr:SusD family protein [Saccharicrinis fermentans DSM 9555 = JCM 21142]